MEIPGHTSAEDGTAGRLEPAVWAGVGGAPPPVLASLPCSSVTASCEMGFLVPTLQGEGELGRGGEGLGLSAVPVGGWQALSP